MNKTAIKNFAVWARVQLIESAKQRAYEYEITEDGENEKNIDTVGGRLLSDSEKKQRNKLIDEIQAKGYTQVMEEAAYTWFNRFIALRFMEVNGYLPSKVRVFTDENGDFKPEILKEAMSIELEGIDRNKVLDLIDQQNNEELYKYLIITQCNDLSSCLPYMFEKIANWTELLFPSNLLRNDSVIGKMVSDIPEEDWDIQTVGDDGKPQGQVEIIGWMYQYYISEKHEHIINIYKGTIKKDDIPAATQLFTTAWVVRYMVDNSLGRYWIERNPESNLAEKLEFFVKPKDGHINYVNEKVEPTELTFFDPCMGSGHILVYAFDVLMEIYRECGYTDRDAAKSIIGNNLYGLDIDKRAYQLAYFAVMMKARSYNRRILSRGVTSNLTYIEESNNIDQFACGSLTTDKNQNQIGEYLVDVYKHAQEYGSLQSVATKDYESFREYLDSLDNGELDIFASAWLNTVRPLMYQLVKQAEIMSKRYVVVCTNPPYMNKFEGHLKDFIQENFKDYKGDLFSAFMFRNFGYCKKDGYSAFMTPFVWMFIKTYEQLREYIISQKAITSLIQMEYSAFEEATVPICSFVLKNGKPTDKALCFRLSDFKGGMEVQNQKVIDALNNPECGYFYESDQSNFAKIPGSPIAYWVNKNIFIAFNNATSMNDLANIKVGLQTGNNEIFLKLWYEINYNNIYFNSNDGRDVKFVPHNKAGQYRKWYGNRDYVVLWENNGEAIKHCSGSRPQNISYYFKEGFSWSDVSSGAMSVRYWPNGCIFDTCAPTLFPKENAMYLFSLLNSKIGQGIMDIMSPTIHYTAGSMMKFPVWINKFGAENLVKENVQISKFDWDSFETSWDFVNNPFVKNQEMLWDATGVGATIKKYYGKHIPVDSPMELCYLLYKGECEERFQELKSNEEELNRIFIDIYGLQEELTPEVEDKDVTVFRIFDSKEEIPDSMGSSKYALTKQDVIKDFISYAVGCMIGRYSLDVDGLAYAGGEWNDEKYKTFPADEDNIIPICDDDYFEDDIVGKFVKFVRVVYGEDTLEENLTFIADALGGKGTSREVIRKYFINDFYKDHCKKYQKRPIYWLFSSGKKDGFKALVYMHRYQPDLIARMRTDYVHEQQERYSTQFQILEDSLQTVSPSERVKINKQITKLKDQSLEIQEYEEKIHHLADQMISIDLDDGVKVNYAKFEDVLEKIK